MLLVRCSKRLHVRFSTLCYRKLSTKTDLAVASEEYTETPEYPPIKDPSFRARKQRENESFYEEIRKLPTVEEKLIKINMPRYYGYKVVQLSDQKLPYNCLSASQHYTRTVFESFDKPNVTEITQLDTNQRKQHIDSYVEAAQNEVKDALEFVYDFFSVNHANGVDMEPAQRESKFTQLVVEQLHRSLTNTLNVDCFHLQEVEVDYNPRHEAFWSVGGINPPTDVIKSKSGRDWQKEMANDCVDRLMQYKATPYLTLRHRYQLPTWKSEEEYRNLELAKQIPRYNYDPRTLGYSTGYQHGTNIPGYWPGSSSNFGCISYQSRAHLHNRPVSCGAADTAEALHAQAIQGSYAWLLAQANYNGFNTYNDLTYPMNTQTIITDGRLWSFYEYQLNTLLISSHHIDSNPLINYCRGTQELKLFESFDEKGKCVGFNADTLRYLVEFYANTPTVQRSLDELQPYLDPEVKRIANYTNEEKRDFLEGVFKRMTSNRPRHLALPEIYLWEKIYKIDNNTRPMDPRRRYFELDINPWKRTLDQHQKVYIPRALRPEGPKSRKKWKPTYYPVKSQTNKNN